MEAERQNLLTSLRARLASLAELRDEGQALRDELLAVDDLLRKIESEMLALRTELASALPQERRATLETRLVELAAAAKGATQQIANAGYESRVEIHEIEAGIATDSALDLREQARRFADSIQGNESE